MRRTVKAWVIQSANDRWPCQRTIDSPWRDDGASSRVMLVFKTRDEARLYFNTTAGVVPCVVTYDDGRPAPRKRPARKGRGGRRGR